MISYKHYLLLTLGLLILGGTGCTINYAAERVVDGYENNITSNLEQESNDIAKHLTVSEKMTTAEPDIYIDIITQYIEAINKDFYKDILAGTSNEWELIGADINLNLLSCLGESEHYKVYYALEDIDKNGIPELFIGGSDGNDTPRYYDLFTFDKTEVINPFSLLDYEFGHRINLQFYSNGIFEVGWSNSGRNYGMDFYKVSSDGYSMESVESVSINHTSHQGIKYYHNAEGNSEISEEEFDSILKGYRDAGNVSLSWIEINR